MARAGLPTHAASTRRKILLPAGESELKRLVPPPKPAVQSLYIDLVDDPDATPQQIHLGFRSGANYLRAYLKSLEEIGINHVALNLRFNQAEIETTLKRLADDILSDFPGADVS